MHVALMPKLARASELADPTPPRGGHVLRPRPERPNPPVGAARSSAPSGGHLTAAQALPDVGDGLLKQRNVRSAGGPVVECGADGGVATPNRAGDKGAAVGLETGDGGAVEGIGRRRVEPGRRVAEADDVEDAGASNSISGVASTQPAKAAALARQRSTSAR